MRLLFTSPMRSCVAGIINCYNFKILDMTIIILIINIMIINENIVYDFLESGTGSELNDENVVKYN